VHFRMFPYTRTLDCLLPRERPAVGDGAERAFTRSGPWPRRSGLSHLSHRAFKTPHRSAADAGTSEDRRRIRRGQALHYEGRERARACFRLKGVIMDRRTFLAAGAAAAWLRPQSGTASARLPIKKAVEFEMLPRRMSIADRFQLARDVAFEQIDCPAMPDEHEAEDAKKAAEKTGLRIHSVMNMAHWDYPLSSADPAVVAKSVKGMETSLRNAHFWGADTVLLVPAVVNPQTTYHDA